MPSDSCETYREQLVDYADGELDAARVAEHVAACPTCRRRLAALRVSLDAARHIWTDAADELATVPAMHMQRLRRPSPARAWRYRLSYGVAAAILLLLAYFVQQPRLLPVAPTEPVVASAAQVEKAIWEAGVAAEMLRVGEMLADSPGGTCYAADRYRFVAEHYPATSAASEASARLVRLNERSMP